VLFFLTGCSDCEHGILRTLCLDGLTGRGLGVGLSGRDYIPATTQQQEIDEHRVVL